MRCPRKGVNFRREGRELFDVCEVSRLIGLGLEFFRPLDDAAKCPPLACDEQFGGGALPGWATSGPSFRCHLDGAAANRLESDGAEHSSGEVGPGDETRVHHQARDAKVTRACICRHGVERLGRSGELRR
jgi:hypothetical protein